MRMRFLVTSAVVLVSAFATFMISDVDGIDWPKAPTVVAGAHSAETGNIDWP
jgi:hypothetical protein